MTILEVEKLKVSYSNHVAIENINFKIEDGEYVCLVGENGSGKTNILEAIDYFYSNLTTSNIRQDIFDRDKNSSLALIALQKPAQEQH